jgi:hypothetical protein
LSLTLSSKYMMGCAWNIPYGSAVASALIGAGKMKLNMICVESVGANIGATMER